MCLPARSLFNAFSCHCHKIIETKKDKKIPGKRKAILCKDGRSKVNIVNRINIFKGLRPYFLFTNLRSNHTKKGSRAIKEKRNENRHIENVKNLGASENAKDENQRLLQFVVNSPDKRKKPKVEMIDNEIL